MAGYQNKTLALTHDQPKTVKFMAEVAITHDTWVPYSTFEVKQDESLTYTFPEGFHAYWIRFRVDQPCKATAQLTYR